MRKPYPSDLTDEQWATSSPWSPPPRARKGVRNRLYPNDPFSGHAGRHDDRGLRRRGASDGADRRLADAPAGLAVTPWKSTGGRSITPPNGADVEACDSQRLLFASIHGYLDPSSGAPLATRDLLELLAARGVDCRVLSTGVLDYERETPLETVLDADRRPGRSRRRSCPRAAKRRSRPGTRGRAGHAPADASSRIERAPDPGRGGRVPRPGRTGVRSVPAPGPAHLRRPPRQPGIDGAGTAAGDRRSSSTSTTSPTPTAGRSPTPRPSSCRRNTAAATTRGDRPGRDDDPLSASARAGGGRGSRAAST